MFKPVSLYLAWRYTRSRRRSRFVSAISLISMLGIAIGIATLITIMSVMNGFDEVIHERFFSMAPQVMVTSWHNEINHLEAYTRVITKTPDVLSYAPYVSGQGMLAAAGNARPSVIFGVDPARESTVSQIPKKMIRGTFTDLAAGDFNMVIGTGLAQQLNVVLGDRVTLMIPKVTLSLAGIQPRFKRFTVAGIFDAGKGFGFNDKMAFIHLKDAQTLLMMGDKIHGFRLRIKDVLHAPHFSQVLQQRLPSEAYVYDWTQQFGAFFNAIKMEKNMMFLLLSLIIVVATFSLGTSLYMVINEKQAEIAILRTLGATPAFIKRTFLAHGLTIGCIGTVLGLLLGLLLSCNTRHLEHAIEAITQRHLISANVYFVDYLPAKIPWDYVALVLVIAVSLSGLVSYIAARVAGKIQPAEALRYE